MGRPRKNVNTTGDADDGSAKKNKVVRRDPEKRREQNRQSQKNYREKQKRRLEDLERRAASNELAAPQSTSSNPSRRIGGISEAPSSSAITTALSAPSAFYDPGSSSYSSASCLDVAAIHKAYDDWLHNGHLSVSSEIDLYSSPSQTNSSTPEIFFDCGCTSLHIRMPPSLFLLPPVPPSPYINNLRLDLWCVLAACFENCRHLGIPKTSFCSDETESNFYRPGEEEVETAQLVATVRSMSSTVKRDLRPLDLQITKSHHPYIDILPFRDLRENLMNMMDEIDEDEFLHDFFNHATCWGGAAGSGGQGMPWDARNWEATEDFLQKWSTIVGGDEGELTRQSRWWQTMRGERIEEII